VWAQSCGRKIENRHSCGTYRFLLKRLGSPNCYLSGQDRVPAYRDVQMYAHYSVPFYGYNKPMPSPRRVFGISFGARGCNPRSLPSHECVKAFSETDFTEDLRKFDVPTLIIHGDADQIVPNLRLGGALFQNCEECGVEGDPRRASWLVHHTRGSDQRLVARLSQGIVTCCARRWPCQRCTGSCAAKQIDIFASISLQEAVCDGPVTPRAA
jgi:hypothetical protein